MLWIASDTGLIYQDKNKGTLKYYRNQPGVAGSLSRNLVFSVYKDRQGSLWAGTGNGLNLMNSQRTGFKSYQHNHADATSIGDGIVTSMVEDKTGAFWVGTEDGLNLMDRRTGTFKHYRNNPTDTGSLDKDAVFSLLLDRQDQLWVGSWNGGGVNLLNKSTGKFTHYLKGNNIFVMYQDAAGVIWAGTEFGMYRYRPDENTFTLFTNPSSEIAGTTIVGLVEDAKQNLWVGSQSGIFKINKGRDEVSVYGKKYGIVSNNLFDMVGYKTTEGEVLFGNTTGYYRFLPDSLVLRSKPPQLLITDFKISDASVLPGTRILKQRIEETRQVKLNFRQNVFSIDFAAIHYVDPDENPHLYMLEGYEKNWRNGGSEKTAAYFNVPPGEYTFKVKAASSEGVWQTQSLRIIISPPWWQRWWAYTLFGLMVAAAIWGIVHYRSRSLIREKQLLELRVARRTKEIKMQKQEIEIQRDNLEKTLTELQAMQAQLIQSEKMASLGELTAGVAHEIQNPLNFVNNFSEVNKDLINELEEEINKGNLKEIRQIAGDIRRNEQKIIQHGKRADAIVKGMLQHARMSTGEKELTDINALADEYLKLSYHNFRAKNKNFYVDLQTRFDENIDKVNLVPQDISRVLLNLYNNAFYSVSDKWKQQNGRYQPTIVVSIQAVEVSGERRVEISVKDNGNGIPTEVVNKIFQPFFTTKPSGQGTGLGLSLSYDIIKAHGGEFRVDNKEGEGAEFIIELPAA